MQLKNVLLGLGLAAMALPALAQEPSGIRHQSFEHSVFYGSESLPARMLPAQNALLQQLFPGWMGSRDRRSGQLADLFGPARQLPGQTISDKVNHLLDNQLSSLGIRRNEWAVISQVQGPKGTHVHLKRRVAGRDVQFARISMRFTQDGRLLRLQLKEYGQPEPAASAPLISAQQAIQAALTGLSGQQISQNTTEPGWVWFPVPAANGYTLRPAWVVRTQGESRQNIPLDLSSHVDAISGELLYRTNSVKESVDLKVKGQVFTQNPLLPASVEPLANLAITIGANTYYTNDTGLLDVAALNLPQTAAIKLQGRWSRVVAVANGNQVPTFNHSIVTNGTDYTFPATAPSSSRHVNAYYHVNKVHDLMKHHMPAFTAMDYALTTNVDVSGSCNAFYTRSGGSSINFFPAGGGCASFAEIGDIVYHEYGHGISDRFYGSMGMTTMSNGALNEGNSDIWGISITGDPVLGKGSFNGGGIIRRYDLAPKVYPQDIMGEVHADGEIIAGAWWDVAQNIGSLDTMTQLFTSTYYDVPDGPNGTEGAVYHEVLISALLNDDLDNNLGNGTPHFQEIVSAFARHGIYLLADARVIHTELSHQPDAAPIPVTASLDLSNPAFFQSLSLHYRIRGNGNWDSVGMVQTGPMQFSGEIPAQTPGTIIDYYFAVHDLLDLPNAFAPAGFIPTAVQSRTTLPYQFGVGLDRHMGTDFETPATGWTIGNVPGDNTSKGIWVQEKPVMAYRLSQGDTLISQPGYDHTSGQGSCLITGNAPATSSHYNTQAIQLGTTTVLSPVIDLSGYQDPVIEYYRWYGNSRGINPKTNAWQVAIRDSNSQFWMQVDQSYEPDYNWRRRIFRLRQYLPSSQYVQLRFVASVSPNASLPLNGQSTVEAGVDDFFIYDKAFPVSVKTQQGPVKASIAPNPAHESVLVSLPAGHGQQGSLELYDLSGRMILNLEVVPGTSAYRIQTAELAAGTYMLLIRTGHSIQSSKILVQH